jgi:predicted alpha/beta superfamily hydrolase
MSSGPTAASSSIARTTDIGVGSYRTSRPGIVLQPTELTTMAEQQAIRTRWHIPRLSPLPSAEFYTADMLSVVLALVLATFASSSERLQDPPPRSEPLVIGETFSIHSSTLKEVRRINVYVPPGYAESPEMRLPVLYMPDGGLGEDFLHIAGLVQIGAMNGTMRPFLLVGIENTERRRDMTGPTTVEADKKIAPRVGGSAGFRAFIRTELMPQIGNRYRTTDEDAIVGESLAGLFVVETFLREPDLFDTYVAFDPSLWWNNDGLVKEASDLLRTRGAAGKKRLYIATSNEPDLTRLAARLTEILENGRFAGIEVQYHRMPEEQHSTIYHPAALRAFRVLFKP